MIPLLADANDRNILGELIAIGMMLFVAIVWVSARLAAHGSKSDEPPGGPLYFYSVVYPNGNRKSVEARSPQEAAEIVADDRGLKHDVVLYSDAGRIVAVVRPNGPNRKWTCFSD